MAWTDERLDDAFERIFNELRELRLEMREEFRAIRSEMAADRRHASQMMWGVWALLIVQIFTAVAVH